MSDFEDLEIPEIIEPGFINWSTKRAYDYAENINDYSDLEELGRAITQARVSLFKVNEKINQYERREIIAKTNYDREHRRAYLTSTAKTEGQKKARADLMCEGLENEFIESRQIKSELIRYTILLRDELASLQTISNNLRQQLKIM